MNPLTSNVFLKKLLISMVAVIILTLFGFGLAAYPGDWFIYSAFSVSANVLLFSGFRRKALFFDAFVGAFLWLGFWLKLTVRLAFLDGDFHLATGAFDGSPEAYDQALIAASVGFTGLLLVSYLRQIYWFSYPDRSDSEGFPAFLYWYRTHRVLCISLFIALVIGIAITNAYFGFYQRGTIPRTVLPFGLNGIYTWLLMFGLAACAAVILKFECTLQDRASLIGILVALFESFMSNVSLLSRGMILNSSSLLYGVLRSLSFYQIKIRFPFVLGVIALFLTLFMTSVLTVNYIRTYVYAGDVQWGKSMQSDAQWGNTIQHEQAVKQTQRSTQVLFLDRWVGIEALMAVSSYPDQGWALWDKAWQEVFSHNRTSFFDEELITSPYLKTDKSKHHFISLPGVVAFFFYPGSLPFLFAAMFLLGGLGAIFEVFVFRFGGQNLILCALLSQVVAFRYAHFGYVPAQSYLLFGTILVNVLLFYAWNKCLGVYYRKKAVLMPTSQESNKGQ